MPEKKKQMGRPTMFPKDGRDVHGRLSKSVEANFEVHRKKLAKLYQEVKGEAWPAKVSDGDVINYLLRGDVSTRLLFKGKL